ncbi:hypothetical protein PRJ_1420 [Pseudomonas sp. XWY-1]|nr:hypothetical protein PRJ_1420 [Pseudomonas sp. XWY-1]
MAEHELWLDSTEYVREPEQNLFVSSHRIIADVEEFDARAQYVGSRLCFRSP